MAGIEFWRNGQRVGVASILDGDLIARLIIRNQQDPVWFDVNGRDRRTGESISWCHLEAKTGDVFTLRLADMPATPQS